MSVLTVQKMHDKIVENVVDEYIKRSQMFTVYQIWEDASFLSGSRLDYNNVRRIVESKINDGFSFYAGWTRNVGRHLTKLDNTVGNIGAAPQIYHPVGASINNYDPHFRLHKTRTNVKKVVANVQQQPQKKVVSSNKTGGLFRFNVWLNGQLVPCSLRQVRGSGGKFIKNRDYEGYGVLNDGSQVIVKQDNEGKLYAVKGA